MKRFKILTAASTGLLLAPLFSITSCSEDMNKIAHSVAESTIEEFKEYCKHPHPSYHLDEIRHYLINRLNSWGYQVMQDNYGNLWFDIPATSGMSSAPKLILQGHMDMVMNGVPESEKPYTGVDLVEDTDADGRPILHARDNLTSIGADDGIGIATILAVAKTGSIPHGPIRAILTADEEVGLYGATALSTAAIDSDLLLNIDGEGNKNHEYIITRGCSGMAEYIFNKKYTPTTLGTSLDKQFDVEILGFGGGHYNDEYNIVYTQEGIKLRGNADRFLLEVLWELINKQGKQVQINYFNHTTPVGGADVSFEPRHLPTHARVGFATDADETTVNTAIKNVYDEFKAKYVNEDWTQIALPTAAAPQTTFTSALPADDTEKLVELFAETMPISVQEWEGTTVEEKIKYNYPTLSYNFASFTIKSDGTFSVGTRGVSGTDANSTKITDFFTKTCATIFSTEETTCNKNYGPWDAGTKTKMIELVTEGFKDQNITPYIDRTRGGVEPACFSKRRPTLQQACIGPRIEGIHFPGETLYVDTVEPMIKAMMYVMKNISKIG